MSGDFPAGRFAARFFCACPSAFTSFYPIKIVNMLCTGFAKYILSGIYAVSKLWRGIEEDKR